MNVSIEVNNTPLMAKRGETILDALSRNGIKVPTLCSMKDFTPTGACRMCVVEVEGKDKLVPSCSYPVEEWLKIKTHSPRVIKARKIIVELLLSNHPDDCLYCERNGNCELQKMAEELNIRERRVMGQKCSNKLDLSSPSIIRDPAKCILCGRCVRVCEETMGVNAIDFINRGNRAGIGTAFDKPMNFSSCINCGQCIIHCPTGALHEKDNFSEILEHIHDPEKVVIIQYSPTVTISLAEEFGIRAGKDIKGIINSALRKIGFDKVFDTSFGSDLSVMELAAEITERHENGGVFPVFSSCCPAWIKYLEQFYPNLIPHLATVKSPQQLMGSIIKSYYADLHHLSPDKIFSVSIMPCTAKKFESTREEMTHKGISDIDAVITTRELARLIRLHGIDMNHIEPELADHPFGIRSSAGKLHATSGGLSEALARTLHYQVKGVELMSFKINELRGLKPRKEYTLDLGQMKLGVVAINGLAQFERLWGEIQEGRDDIHFVEVMACPSGCIGGGGQPFAKDEKTQKARQVSLYEIDETETIKVPYKNPYINELYQQFLDHPLSPRCRGLLHTTYSHRDVLI